MHKEFKGIDHEFEVNGSEIQMKHKGFQMNERLGELCVGIALCLRATSLMFGKIALRTMGPFLLMGTRFLIAFVVIGLIFNKRRERSFFTVRLSVCFRFSQSASSLRVFRPLTLR